MKWSFQSEYDLTWRKRHILFHPVLAYILLDISTSFISLEHILIQIMVLLGSRATSSSVELLLRVTILQKSCYYYYYYYY